MSFVLATARKDWMRLRRDPTALLLWLGIPLVVGGILTLLTGGRDGPEPQAHVLVVDRDDSFVSGLLLGALSQDAAGGFIRAERVEEEEGRERIEKGGANALLVVPEGFGQALLDDTPTTLELVKNPTDRVLSGVVEEGLRILVDGAFYFQRVAGDELRPMFDDADLDEGPSDELVSSVSIRINALIDRLESRLFPPVLQVATGPPPEVAAADSARRAAEALETGEEIEDEEDDDSPGIAFLFLPGLLFMSLLFTAQGIAGDIWRERELHTLRRMVVSPRPVAAFLLGKTLAAAGVVAGIATVALAVGTLYFGLAWSMFPLAVAWCALSGGMLVLLLTVLKLYASSARAADIFSMVIVFPLMMLGGSFFPFEAMPDFMVAIGRFTPNGWALLRLKEILLARAEWSALAVSLAGLVAVVTLLFAWAAARLRSFARAA